MRKVVQAILCVVGGAVFAGGMPAKEPPIGSTRQYTLRNGNGMEVKVSNYGARITSIRVPDRNGKTADVVLGYDSAEAYINALKHPYFGATVGRCCGRIAGAQFKLDGRTYQLAANNGANHLHGGRVGFDKVIWKTEMAERGRVRLAYLARDGEEGYPGNLQVTVTFSLNPDNELRIDYAASTDRKTPVNLTNHTYFNLKGEGRGDVLGHELMIHAANFTPLNSALIPTGEIRPVAGTPLDFTQSKPIGRDIAVPDEQLILAHGYDHNFVLDDGGKEGLRSAAEVYEPESGRILEVLTTEPGLQLYTGNFLAGDLKGKSGRPYVRRGGLCLETQHFPDSPNQPSFPNTILKPGESWRSTTVFRFGVRP